MSRMKDNSNQKTFTSTSKKSKSFGLGMDLVPNYRMFEGMIVIDWIIQYIYNDKC